MNVYLDHVPVAPRLALPRSLAFAQRYLRAFDRDLRLRKSVENAHVYVLERRCRRRPAVNTAMRDVSDMHIQARDGYIHVASVHPNVVARPWAIVEELLEGGRDAWRAGGADRVFDEVAYEQEWARETRRRRRLRILREIALEHYDLLSRRGDREGGTERTRISNVGTTPRSQAA